jgi:uncharacterized membrane protein
MTTTLSKSALTAVVLCNILLTLARSVSAAEASTGLQDLGTIADTACIQGLSADGATAVGTFGDASGNDHVFRWTQANGVQTLDRVIIIGTDAGISADGKTIVSTYYDLRDHGRTNVLIWHPDTGEAKKIIEMDGKLSYVSGVSADGSIISGRAGEYSSEMPLFRWTSDGRMELLGAPHMVGFKRSSMSSDGNVIVGSSGNASANQFSVFRWTRETGLQDLGGLGNWSVWATGLSQDGKTIVGSLQKTPSSPLTYASWTQEAGWKELDLHLPGTKFVYINAISNDGKIVAGCYHTPDLHQSAFIENLSVHDVSPASPSAQQAASDLPELSPEQQTRYNTTLSKGRPAQIYSLALDMMAVGRPDLSDKLFQTLIDRFPDDPYTAKAIDRRDALRSAVKQQQGAAAQQHAQAQQRARAQADQAQIDQQRVAACQENCNSAQSSCSMQAANQFGTTLGQIIGNGMNHNSAGMQQSAAQIGDPNACQHQFDQCTSSCQ